MNFIVRNKIILTSGLTLINLVVVILLALLLTTHTTRFLLSEEQVFSLIHNSEEIMLELARSEADVKHYLLTQNEEDIIRFKQRKAPLLERLNKLQTYYSGGPKEKQYNQLHQLVMNEITVLENAAGNKKQFNTSYLDDIKKIQASMVESQKMLLKEKGENLELKLRSREYVLVSASIASIIISFFSLGTIVTDLNAKRRKQHELEYMNSTKDKFFSLISHDLKGPAQNMISLSEMLISEPEMSEDEKSAFVHLINASAKKNFNLLNNLLEWARLQMGNIENRISEFDLNEAAEESIRVMDEKAYRKSIKIINKIPAETVVSADKNAICSVIRNLISNGLKYTRQGGKIILSCADTGNGFMEVYIADTGIGMDSQTRKKLFKPGKQISMTGTEGESGTGIGLLLCKEFVERNQGTIRCESKKGEGSTFIFTVPVKS